MAYTHYQGNSKLILFGGGNSTFYGMDDVNVYGIDGEGWELPPNIKKGPQGRMQGGLAYTDKGLLIFGGIGGTPSQPVYFNDMWLLTGL